MIPNVFSSHIPENRGAVAAVFEVTPACASCWPETGSIRRGSKNNPLHCAPAWILDHLGLPSRAPAPRSPGAHRRVRRHFRLGLTSPLLHGREVFAFFLKGRSRYTPTVEPGLAVTHKADYVDRVCFPFGGCLREAARAAICRAGRRMMTRKYPLTVAAVGLSILLSAFCPRRRRSCSRPPQGTRTS